MMDTIAEQFAEDYEGDASVQRCLANAIERLEKRINDRDRLIGNLERQIKAYDIVKFLDMIQRIPELEKQLAELQEQLKAANEDAERLYNCVDSYVNPLAVKLHHLRLEKRERPVGNTGTDTSG